MGSSYFGELSLANERGNGSSSLNSRKGKKSNSEKPRQPQRGLGVAQLEKIRLHGQITSSPSPYYNPNSLPTSYASSTFNHANSSEKPFGAMGFGEYERANLRDDSQYNTAARWDSSNGSILETQHFAHPSLTSCLQNPPVEGSHSTNSKRKVRSGGSISRDSDAICENQEVDLELRLSI